MAVTTTSINALTDRPTPANTDEVIISDASGNPFVIRWDQLLAFFQSLPDISGGKFFIEDVNGNQAFAISPDGQTKIARLNDETAQRLRIQLGTTEPDSGGMFRILDSNGNVAFKIRGDGQVAISKFTAETITRLNAALSSGSNKINTKKISIIGDSISTPAGGTGAGLVFPEQYYSQLQVNNGCTINVSAVGGTGLMAENLGGDAFTATARMNTVNASFTPDVILIFGGINDFGTDQPLGVLGDSTTATFYGALDYMYNYLMNRVKTARVFHMTPMHINKAPFGNPEKNTANIFLYQYVNAIKEVAHKYGVGILDTYQYTGITYHNITLAAGSDGVHPNAAGHQKIYNLLLSLFNLYL